MNRRGFLKGLGLAGLALGAQSSLAAKLVGGSRPKAPKNIIVILSDDVGWGDISCYGPSKGLTPAIDRLARDGMQFMDAHSPAATCTPTRFSFLTGEFAWRKPGHGIAPGDAAQIISSQTNTLPRILQRDGVKTGAVGKWHLGYGPGPGKTNWNADYIKPGPREIGFDYSFLMPATGDRVPCVYVENQRVVNRDPADPIEVNYKRQYPGEVDGIKDRKSLTMNWSHGHNQAVVNGIGRIGYMKGGTKARWDDYTMADVLAGKAVEFITKHKDEPFFLYFCPHDVHVPRCPHPRFQGKSGMGPRGDAILQLDDQVRQVVEAVDRLGLAEDTLIIYTSDNGPVLDDGYQDQAVAKLGKHRPAGGYRGTKYTPYEGGHRVPFVARWTGHMPAGKKSNALFSLIDLGETFTALRGIKLAKTDLPDSNAVPELFTRPSVTGRPYFISQDYRISIREGDWKYIVPPFVGNTPKARAAKAQPLNGELFNIKADPAEKTNLIKQHPAIAKRLFAKLVQIDRDGASRESR